MPVEEYIFYLTGFLAVLLLYVWLCEYWLAAYNVPDYLGEARKVRRLLQFHPISLIVALVLIGAAWLYKKHLALPDRLIGFDASERWCSTAVKIVEAPVTVPPSFSIRSGAVPLNNGAL